MLSIHTNLSSLITQNSMKTSTNKLNQAIERMSSGYKVNHAKDNAANYSISTNMSTKISAYEVAESNTMMGLDMVATASESLSLIEDKLMRLRALATQANNGTYGAQSLNAINAETNAIVDEINRLYNTTEYNGVSLTKGKIDSIKESSFINEIDRRDTSQMTKLGSVNKDTRLDYGVYSISTPDELAQLATMTNKGLIGVSTEFVLADDINLEDWCNANASNGGWVPIGQDLTNSYVDATKVFGATFDGNGYVISNLKIDRNETFQGLFGFIWDATLKNIAVEDAEIKNASTNAGILLGYGRGAVNIDNCYSTGSVVSTGATNQGGLVGYMHALGGINTAKMTNCYSDTSVTGYYSTGGLCGAFYDTLVYNCYSKGTVTANSSIIGALAGRIQDSSFDSCYSEAILSGSGGLKGLFGQASGKREVLLKNTYYYGEITNLSGILVGNLTVDNILKINNCGNSDFYNDKSIKLVNDKGNNYKLINPIVFNSGEKPLSIENKSNVNIRKKILNIQVGINSSNSSEIELSLGYNIDGLESLRSFSTNFSAFKSNINNGKHIRENNFIAQIDLLLDAITEKATLYGSAQNRLESALDEISTQYENLVSSRSTIRDADMAEVSSTYIQQQILQDASATMMAMSRNLRAESLLGIIQSLS